MREYSEDALVEQPAIALFRDLGWQTANCFHETYGSSGTLGRETRAEVVLTRRLRAALQSLNPTLPPEGIEQAIEALTRDRSAQTLASANREVYRLLRDGVKVSLRDVHGEETIQSVHVIDWRQPAKNDFFLASQLWITGEMYTRRADLIGFVNGLPLVFIELKATHRRLENAYNDNLRDYKDTIPQLFWYNAAIILSNGSQTRLGSITAGWEHFFEWKKITSEGERGVVSLETAIRGVCDRARLLDLVENFTLFDDAVAPPIKLLAKNHQYLGVNNAIEAVHAIRANQGRLGVFWHTQGAGKSYSMVFFSQKVLETIPGNWTFLIITDRQELDEQIYKTFAGVGAVTEKEVHATSGAHLQQLLREDHRNIFTLIQKFQTEPGQPYPVLSERSDIIVITDEAHRSQYATLALNMRRALPNAAFIAFTGTPLIRDDEEKTRAVFGDYVSIYNFAQSIADGTTVPLYYENRIPELQLTNPNLNADIERLVEAADLDEEQERRIEREFAREYALITRDDRLERIAQDIVAHFLRRGERGKAMIVAVDKATAVRMYDKVRKYWQQEHDRLSAQLASFVGASAGRPHAVSGGRATATDAPLEYRVPKRSATRPESDPAAILLGDEEIQRLRDEIAYLDKTDMAVVVSQSQNEIADFRAKGLEIAPHRKRMVTEDLEAKFKNPDDPLRIVFVCAMWMTGFDIPSLSTVYLDKPMRNHTLMQTIARANRVWRDKTNGLIVDYIGIFRDLQKALAIYGSSRDSGEAAEEMPVQEKAELVEQLRLAIAEAISFCELHEIEIDRIMASVGLERVGLLDDAVEALLVNDEVRKKYLALAAEVARLYRAILPDPSAGEFTQATALFTVLAGKIRATLPEPDISGVMAAIERLLDLSIATEGYVIRDASGEYAADRRIDLGQIDFDALQRKFAEGRKRTAAQILRGQLNARIQGMIRLNRSRIDYLERLQRLIDEYNAGSMNVEIFYEQLVTLTRELDVEDQRAVAEQLSEEELALFDLLTRAGPALTEKERDQLKRAARDLLATLKREKLVLDWKKRQSTRAAVRVAIEETLDRDLPSAYTADAYSTTCDTVFQHIYESYYGAGHSIYAA